MYAVTSTLDLNAVTGVNIGHGPSNCWERNGSDAYRADITSIVQAKKDGNYTWSSGAFGFEGNGVSIIAILDGGDKEVIILEGNDSSDDGWNVHLDDIVCADPCQSTLELHVADGQDAIDDALTLAGNTLSLIHI